MILFWITSIVADLFIGYGVLECSFHPTKNYSDPALMKSEKDKI